MHSHLWPVLTDAIIQVPMQSVTSYLEQRPAEEVVLVKLHLYLERHLLRPQIQIGDHKMFAALPQPDNTFNLFCIPFIRCMSTALVHLKVVTTLIPLFSSATAPSENSLLTATFNTLSFTLHVLFSHQILIQQIFPGILLIKTF